MLPNAISIVCSHLYIYPRQEYSMPGSFQKMISFTSNTYKLYLQHTSSFLLTQIRMEETAGMRTPHFTKRSTIVMAARWRNAIYPMSRSLQLENSAKTINPIITWPKAKWFKTIGKQRFCYFVLNSKLPSCNVHELRWLKPSTNLAGYFHTFLVPIPVSETITESYLIANLLSTKVNEWKECSWPQLSSEIHTTSMHL